MKTYLVSGPSPVFGNAPGSTFKADLDPAQEKRLVERGSISTDASGLAKKPRKELDKVAEAAGVERPQDEQNKEAVARAIRKANKEH